MHKPISVSTLDTLGRVRLSKHFFMRDMLHCEIELFVGPSVAGREPSGLLGFAT